MIAIKKRYLFASFGGIALCVFQADTALALAANETVKLTPHRAVYEMTLDESRPGSGIGGIRGRMVFEFTGSVCEGYTLNMRLVTQVTDTRGQPMVTDLRSSTWEQGDGRKFRFNSSQYLNDKLSEATTGDAARHAKGDKVSVKVNRPKKSELELPADVLFPTQHSKELLRAALDGRTILQARRLHRSCDIRPRHPSRRAMVFPKNVRVTAPSRHYFRANCRSGRRGCAQAPT